MQHITSGDTDHTATPPTTRTKPASAAGVAAVTTSNRHT